MKFQGRSSAMQVLCQCYASAVLVLCQCNANAMLVLCWCYAIAMLELCQCFLEAAQKLLGAAGSCQEVFRCSADAPETWSRLRAKRAAEDHRAMLVLCYCYASAMLVLPRCCPDSPRCIPDASDAPRCPLDSHFHVGASEAKRSESALTDLFVSASQLFKCSSRFPFIAKTGLFFSFFQLFFHRFFLHCFRRGKSKPSDVKRSPKWSPGLPKWSQKSQKIGENLRKKGTSNEL